MIPDLKEEHKKELKDMFDGRIVWLGKVLELIKSMIKEKRFTQTKDETSGQENSPQEFAGFCEEDSKRVRINYEQ